ncbi:helix-turn-helix domain-containing protein [Butyrivibrio sp. MB2005]|uniref:helix-turn-helix domain-containing protein n=1 Tax=Butyrivibrio sp. MB2005 TaxID=1280678 RepID=UPI0004232A5F|nr:helix-turn-helix transcriptional regulator [Butyrivibrio sp. MB2005]
MNNSIGRKIYNLRKQKGITQNELAQYLFVAPQTISKWESGNGSPDISLIPKIANLFEVSLDYLFDMTDAQRVKDMVLKYSVLKDDHSFDAASSVIESMLCDSEYDEIEKADFYALKSHLYLQRARDSINKALDSANTALEIASDSKKTPLIMQAILLRLMSGDYENVRAETKNAFANEPNSETLYIYLEVLLILNCYDEIILIIESDDNAKRIMSDKSASIPVWIQYFQASTHTRDLKKAKELYDKLSSLVPQDELLNMSVVMVRLYSDHNDPELNNMKSIALSLLDKIEINEYIKKEIAAQIN